MKITWLRHLTWIIILFLPVNNNSLFAQETFSSFKLSAGITINYNENLIHRYWSPGKGLQFAVETPFYFGNLQLGLITIPFHEKDEEQPGFREYYLSAGIGKDIVLPYKISLSGGIRAGYFIMNFDDDSLSDYQKNESEFTAGVNLGVKYEVIANLFISVSSDFTVLFTNEQLKFYYVSAGIAYKFNSPAWLKELLN